MGCVSSEDNSSSSLPSAPHPTWNGSHRAKKLFLVGEVNVGKTCIFKALKKVKFNNDAQLTIVAHFENFNIETKKDSVHLEIYDISGSEKFLPATASCFRSSDMAFLVFDLTDFETFLQLTKWIKLLRENSPCVKIVLIGNKMDLESSRAVSIEALEAFAEDNKIEKFMEVSAKTNDGILDLFESLIELAQ